MAAEEEEIDDNYITERHHTFKNDDRTIDFVLVWDETYEESTTDSAIEKRKIYELNLIEEGLELEYESQEGGVLHFVKVHAPLEVLRRYSEILKLRLPMKEELCKMRKRSRKNIFHGASTYISRKIPGLKKKNIFGKIKHFWSDWWANNIYVDRTKFPDQGHKFTAIYSRDKEYLFDIYSPGFFMPSVRSRIVQFILDRTCFAAQCSSDIFGFGIERLIDSNVYAAAYPLHDGDLRTPGSMRNLLYKEWASVKKCFRYQPVDYVKNYFGVKIGLYFAWLGFYTYMLILASVVGISSFLYSWFRLKKNEPVEDICSGEIDAKMCPLCDHFCDYWDLKDTCFHAKVSFIVDNYTTVIFAIFMSIWAAMFLELWKRYSAEITHRWDLTGFDTQEENPRPQYLAQLAQLDAKHRVQYKLNVVTDTVEPTVPFWRVRLPATLLSFSVVLLLVFIALATVLGVVLYRMSVLAALSVYGGPVITSYAIIITTSTAAAINLCCICLFNLIYSWLAEYLTEKEMLRTQTEFDDSLTLKLYLLQFVNYYASIFYIAFCKGKLVGYPAEYNRLFGFRQEECAAGGCLMELCIQLAIIMIGKQAVATLLEMGNSLVYKWWNQMRIRRYSRRGNVSRRWEKDYQLVDWGPHALYPEYLEMILQYGFVTIFVSAFPLAPVFALINNILEMRLDAKKLLTYHRRPVSQRVRDIGVWFKILHSISKLAVITNAFIIAFTSDFIPHLVYLLNVSPNYSLEGYLNHSLAYMDTKDLDLTLPPATSLKYCRYPDYREPPWSPNKYDKTTMYWNVLVARLAFVVVFENVVVLVVLLVKWCVPDTPARLKEQIRREAYITNEIIIAEEAARSRRGSIGESTPITPSDKGIPNIKVDGFFFNNISETRHTKTNRQKKDTANSSDFVVEVTDLKNINRSVFTRQQIKDAALVHRASPCNSSDIVEVTV